MKARKLTAQKAVALIHRFCTEIGAEQMYLSYGWRSVPQGMKFNEHCWEFVDMDVNQPAPDVATVGWGSMFMDTRDADDDEALLVIGVFPEFQRRGYRTKILDWMVKKAKSLGADRVSMTVLKRNEAHYQRTLRECEAGTSGWLYAGDIWYPPTGSGYFVYPLS